eukprot:CAMPEP_0168750854 /NCGR_PEP_ID=MMETSP0724-20121128/17508_1 /TAXON_ID=265536 /ORGANISM="Amphiprora sp., Strain CCMP467" /LENGTH=580 /DNA_ID=CAMNT_0008798931 /DNA_START=549 /DNA_END=2288 /DNA_ORIENTATION=+
MSNTTSTKQPTPANIDWSSNFYDAAPPAFNEDEPTRLGLWSPQASPSCSTGRRPSSSHNDDLSMNIFATSFDSFEPTLRATFDRELPPASLSPQGHHPRNERRSLQQRDISLPELKHPNDSEMSLGHISPIRLPYNNDTQPRRSPPRDTRDNDVNWPCDCNGNAHAPVSNPFFVMRFAASAFANVKYKLPCLKGPNSRPIVNMNGHGKIRQYRSHICCELDTKTATLRVEASICAFGGTVQYSKDNPMQGHGKIFREQSPAASKLSAYEQSLPNRYSMNGSRISWDVEENPPIHIVTAKDNEGDASRSVVRNNNTRNSHEASPTGETTSVSRDGVEDTSSGKTKYRCKRCGQLKNNHVCPYRQPLQRSIGIMVYPALNSFTAFEPGQVAPPLTNMNNFVSYSGDSEGTSHAHPTPTGASVQPTMGVYQTAASITPEGYSGLNSWASYRPPSPQTSLSGHSDETMEKGPKKKRAHDEVADAMSETPAKRNLFVSSINLQPEHYRSVNTESFESDVSSPFEYPAIPLTFSERKRLSDTLFFLSKEVPTLTQDCALLLREARENDEWDTAVAELMTQVIIGLF